MRFGTEIMTNFTPPVSTDVGTSVLEVDGNGNPTGTSYVSRGWTTICRPAGRTDGCPQWISTLIVSATVAGANAGNSLLPAVATVASSSPSSRDVTVIYVDTNGNQISRFVKPFLFVPDSTPDPSGNGDEIANVIWISDVQIQTPAVTAAEQACNAGGPGPCA
ncbi:MAG TPA: hypothetical protein VMF91_05360 [Bryobacteraceae bacterium]|nr:hypothetical protein [Bryobacteraceae bacterium]